MTRSLSTGAVAILAALAFTPAAHGVVTPDTPVLDCAAGPEMKPAKCAVLPKGAALYQGADLDRLHWRQWGHGTATAHGCDWGFHHGQNLCRNHPVTITVYRIKDYLQRYGAIFYTRLRERFPDGRTYVFNMTPFGRGEG